MASWMGWSKARAGSLGGWLSGVNPVQCAHSCGAASVQAGMVSHCVPARAGCLVFVDITESRCPAEMEGLPQYLRVSQDNLT